VSGNHPSFEDDGKALATWKAVSMKDIQQMFVNRVLVLVHELVVLTFPRLTSSCEHFSGILFPPT
jgi:hypothetical protein